MTSNTLREVIKQVDTMTLSEQLELIAYIAEKARQTPPTPKPKHKWREIRGLVKEAALGEDAQAWVSRTRMAADSYRD